jgi:hypothetical protein
MVGGAGGRRHETRLQLTMTDKFPEPLSGTVAPHFGGIAAPPGISR